MGLSRREGLVFVMFNWRGLQTVTFIRCTATFSLGARPDAHHLSRSTSPAFASRDSAPTTSRSASTLSFDAPRRTRRPDVSDLALDPFVEDVLPSSTFSIIRLPQDLRAFLLFPFCIRRPITFAFDPKARFPRSLPPRVSGRPCDGSMTPPPPLSPLDSRSRRYYIYLVVATSLHRIEVCESAREEFSPAFLPLLRPQAGVCLESRSRSRFSLSSSSPSRPHHRLDLFTTSLHRVPQRRLSLSRRLRRLRPSTPLQISLDLFISP